MPTGFINYIVNFFMFCWELLVMVRVTYSWGELRPGEVSHPSEVMHPDTMFTIRYMVL
jgi:hypothetical protein